MRNLIYTIDGDNLGTGYFLKLENAQKALEGMTYKKVLDMDIKNGSKSVYSRESLGLFGTEKIQTAYIGWVYVED